MAYAASFRIQPALTIDEATARNGVAILREVFDLVERERLWQWSGRRCRATAGAPASQRLARHHRARDLGLVRLRPRAVHAGARRDHRRHPALSPGAPAWAAGGRRGARWSSRWSASGPSGIVERRLGYKDPQIVCVDEVAGVLVTWIAAPPDLAGADRRRPGVSSLRSDQALARARGGTPGRRRRRDARRRRGGRLGRRPGPGRPRPRLAVEHRRCVRGAAAHRPSWGHRRRGSVGRTRTRAPAPHESRRGRSVTPKRGKSG